MNMTSSSLTPARAGHAQRVLRLVHTGDAHTRAQVADATGMSPSLVSRVTTDLLRAGALEARSQDPGERPGRPIERLALDPNAGTSVGVEVTDERLLFVACDATGGVRARWEETHEGGEVAVTAVEALARRIASSAQAAAREASPLVAVGAALHEVVTSDGAWTRADAPSPTVPARSILADHAGVPVVVDDVSRAFAEAEHRFGAGREAPDMLYLFLGRNAIGSGIFAGNTLLRSHTGICGEIGHIQVEPEGPRCSCGNRGCLETVATHAALRRRADAYLAQGVRSRLDTDTPVHEILAAARTGDKVATLVVHDLAGYLRTALTGAIAVTGATTVVLGGDVRASGASLPTVLREALRGTLLQPLAERVRVRYAELDVHAGAHGVAVAALDASIRSGELLRRRLERGIAM